MIFEDIGLAVPNILLPKKGTDMNKWAVVACDQYTSEPEYWEKVEKYVGAEPSTNNLIFPEVYLEQGGKEERIQKINATMKKYLEGGVLEDQGACFILVDRKVPPHNKSRKGLVVALDLETYDYNKGAQTLIRATEGTILERIPPRVQIRENAPIEFPHIMVLLDDPEKTVIEPLFNEKFETVYETPLMMDSGHITGYKITDKTQIEKIANAIRALAKPEVFNKKYECQNKGVLLYAMGDGNHSLATAKSIWEKTKKETGDMNHPARYALVELVNVHDSGLEFEPIHRVLFNLNTDHMFTQMKTFFEKEGSALEIEYVDNKATAYSKVKSCPGGCDCHCIVFVQKEKFGIMKIKSPKLSLPVASLQNFLDNYLKENKNTHIDYVHGEKVVVELSNKENNFGILLDVLSKNELFKTVVFDGALPRKTFSMGEAEEKRFYLEARRIQK